MCKVDHHKAWDGFLLFYLFYLFTLFIYIISCSHLICVVDDCHLPEAHGSEENVGPVKREVALHAYTCNIKKECGSPHSKIYNTFWRTVHKDLTFFMLHAHACAFSRVQNSSL